MLMENNDSKCERYLKTGNLSEYLMKGRYHARGTVVNCLECLPHNAERMGLSLHSEAVAVSGR